MPSPILVLDDEEKFARMLQDLLQQNGYEADICLKPEEALTRLRDDPYELVISDYKMPEMDGADFLTEARRINPNLPVIMISGLMNMPELIKVANIGVTLVLEKPFDTKDFIQYVSRFVSHDEPDGAIAAAMDMEASEINFNADDPASAFSYPSPATCMSDRSFENKRFLEALWQVANDCRHLFFFASAGTEIRLVAREMLVWLEHSAEEPVVRLDIFDTESAFTRSWIESKDDFPSLVLVDLRDAALEAREVAKLLNKWIDLVEGCGKDLSATRILYALPTGLNFDKGLLELNEERAKLVNSEFPLLISMRERLLDTAGMVVHELGSEVLQQLGIEASLQLIHYPWPGGYEELRSKLATIRRRSKRSILTPREVKELLLQRSNDPGSLDGALTIEHYLKRRQREYILLHREPGEELKSTLLRLGIEKEGIDTEAVMRDEILLYPEILLEASTDGGENE
jgi:DNA-binding response OmpR family regulator